MKLKFTLVLVLVVTSASIASLSGFRSLSQNKTAADVGLGDAERDLLNEINQVRAQPQLYASYLEKLRPMFNGKQYTAAGRDPLITEEGWSAVDDAINFLKAAKPVPALIASRGLSQAALVHVRDQAKTGATGHRGANSSMIEQRVKPFGRWEGAIGENICYGNDSARERILTWLIDDGFASRGHRRRLLSSDYQVAGISCGAHPQFSAMCVLTLAGGFMEFNPAAAKTGTTTTKTATTSTRTTTTPTKSSTTVKSKNANLKNRKL